MSSIYNEIVSRLSKVPLGELPRILTVIDEAAKGPRVARTKSVDKAILGHMARQTLELKTPGSKIDEVERAIVAHAIETTGGNVSAAARLLGIERKAMERRLVLYGVRR